MDVKAAGQPALSTANVQQAMHKELRFFRAFLNVDVLVFIIFIGLLSFLGVIVVLTMNLWVFRSMVWPLLWGLLTSAACWPAKEWVAATTVTIVTEPAKCADAYLALLISPWTLAQQAQPSPTKRKANAPRRNPCIRCTVSTMKFAWKTVVIGIEGLLYCVYVVAVYAIEDARRMLWLLLVLWSAAATCYFNLAAVLFTLQILVIALVLSVVLALVVTVPRRIGASGYCVVLCRVVGAITSAISSAVEDNSHPIAAAVVCTTLLVTPIAAISLLGVAAYAETMTSARAVQHNSHVVLADVQQWFFRDTVEVMHAAIDQAMQSDMYQSIRDTSPESFAELEGIYGGWKSLYTDQVQQLRGTTSQPSFGSGTDQAGAKADTSDAGQGGQTQGDIKGVERRAKGYDGYGSSLEFIRRTDRAKTDCVTDLWHDARQAPLCIDGGTVLLDYRIAQQPMLAASQQIDPVPGAAHRIGDARQSPSSSDRAGQARARNAKEATSRSGESERQRKAVRRRGLHAEFAFPIDACPEIQLVDLLRPKRHAAAAAKRRQGHGHKPLASDKNGAVGVAEDGSPSSDPSTSSGVLIQSRDDPQYRLTDGAIVCASRQNITWSDPDSLPPAYFSCITKHYQAAGMQAASWVLLSVQRSNVTIGSHPYCVAKLAAIADSFAVLRYLNKAVSFVSASTGGGSSVPPVLSLDWTSLARSTVGASRVIFSLMLGASSSALQTTAAMFTFSLSLFYLLERRQYWLSWISPSESSDDSETTRFTQMFGSSIRQVFTAISKTALFHAWAIALLLTCFDVHFKSLLIVLSTITEIVPYVPSLLVMIPPSLEVYFRAQYPLASILVFLGLRLVIWYYSTLFYERDMRNCHFFLVGLSIVAAVTCFGLHGIVVGPLLLSLMAAAVELAKSGYSSHRTDIQAYHTPAAGLKARHTGSMPPPAPHRSPVLAPAAQPTDRQHKRRRQRSGSSVDVDANRTPTTRTTPTREAAAPQSAMGTKQVHYMSSHQEQSSSDGRLEQTPPRVPHSAASEGSLSHNHYHSMPSMLPNYSHESTPIMHSSAATSRPFFSLTRRVYNALRMSHPRPAVDSPLLEDDQPATPTPMQDIHLTQASVDDRNRANTPSAAAEPYAAEVEDPDS